MNIVDTAVNEIVKLRQSLRTAGDTWGTTPDERAAAYPCDDLLPGADQWLFRGIDVDAPPALTFRWLCQLRAGPYSYDWIDNGGRQSPRELTPGLEDIEVGQRAVAIFHIAGVEPGVSITIHAPKSVFGEMVATYRAVPVGADRSRIVVKLGVVYPTGLHGELMRDLLPFGDLVMMRKQLQNLAALAARDARSSNTGAATST
jgi:hypothetical protein